MTDACFGFWIPSFQFSCSVFAYRHHHHYFLSGSPGRIQHASFESPESIVSVCSHTCHLRVSACWLFVILHGQAASVGTRSCLAQCFQCPGGVVSWTVLKVVQFFQQCSMRQR
jgi:hypothetical protein